MKRRNFLKKAGIAGAGAMTAATVSGFPTPAISQGVRELRLVSTFPKNFPGLGTSVARLVDRVDKATDGKLKIKLYNAGELVGALEVFDAVANGDADVYYSSEYFYTGKSKALAFFAAVPFGMTAPEFYAWIYHGGGQELWDELSAQFGIKPFPSSNTGVQMGGWLNKEINSIDDFKGLKFRMPGLGGEVLRRLGVSVVTLHGGEIFQALQSGAIDGTEWVGPWHDLAFGFYKIAKYYYWPGFHEPSSATSHGINLSVWESLRPDEQELLKMAFESETHLQTTEYDAANPDALDTLLTVHGVELRRYPDEMISAMAQTAQEVVAEVGNADDLSRKVWDSYRSFAEKAQGWTEIGVQAYMNARTAGFQKG